MAILLSLTAFFSLHFFSGDVGDSFSGAHDFSEYWAAFKIAQGGGDSYDPAGIFAAEKALGWVESEPLMMWNPPWTLPLLAPLFMLQFDLAVKVFAAFNIISLFLVAGIFWLRNDGRREWLPVYLIFGMLFFPFLESLFLGQLGWAHSLLFIIFICLYGKRYDLLAGVFFALLTIKPHIYYLYFIVGPLVAIREKRFKLLYGFVLGMASLLFLTMIVVPEALFAWIKLVFFSEGERGGAVSVWSYSVPTLVGVVKLMLTSEDGLAPLWPMVVIPGTASIVAVMTVIKSKGSDHDQFSRRQFGRRRWFRSELSLLFISILTSPYGWIFDQGALILPIFAVVVIAGELIHRGFQLIGLSFISITFALQIFTWHFAFQQGRHHHELFWYPVLVMLIWSLANLIKERFLGGVMMTTGGDKGRKNLSAAQVS